MNEILDILDLLDGLSLGDGVIDLKSIGELLDNLDFFSIEAADIDALDALRNVGIEDFDLAISDVPLESAQKADWVELPDFDLTGGNVANQVGAESPFLDVIMEPELAGNYLVEELNEYPPSIVEGLTHVDYHAEADGTTLGFWQPQGDGTASITLNDHIEDLSMTFHHEVGHHFFENNPEIGEAVLEKASGSPLLETFLFQNLLSQYEFQEQGSELLAECFAYYKTNPAVLADIDPALFSEIDKWYHFKA